MSMKAIVTADEFTGLSSEFQAEYTVQEDGTHLLDVTVVNGFELADNVGLKSALQKERGSATEANKKFKVLTEKFGDLDPIAAHEAIAKIAELAEDGVGDDAKAKAAREAWEGALTKKYDSAQQKLLKKHSDEIKEVADKLGISKVQLEKVLITSEITKAVAAAKGIEELLAPAIRQDVRMVEDDNGLLGVRVVEADGTVRLSTKSGSTEPMTIAERVEEMKGNDVFARAFDGSGSAGTGAASSTGGAGSSGGNGATLRISAVDARDVGKFRVAHAQAEKQGKTLEIVGG